MLKEPLMQEIRGNLWNPPIKFDAICITTNGFVKTNGEAVMGRGCAKEAASKYPGLSKLLGDQILKSGNQVYVFERLSFKLISFPVKCVEAICLPDKSNVVKHMQSKFMPGNTVPGWACKADNKIICKSAQELVRIVNACNLKSIILPRPGCGAGELEWNCIRKLLSSVLDDRFHCITY